jgi:YHYH protein
MRPFNRQILALLGLCGAVTAITAMAMGGASLGAAGSSSTNPAFLPIGDGKVTTSGPRRGYIYTCQNGSLPGGGPPGGAGAFADGPWIRSDGTYDLTAKATVDGAVRWSNAKFKAKRTRKRRIFSGNGLPTKQTTGEFPIRASDDAYKYDRNPNSINAQSERYSLPRHPKRASKPNCLSMGPIGIAKNGVAIFNALDAQERDAVAHEVQDSCGGHPQQQGLYHYHAIPNCLIKGQSKKKPSGLVGFALDGYPIYGPRGAGGKLLTNKDLDVCHGQKSKVWLDGRRQRVYHYNATLEYPYTLGCFRGTPQSG